MNLLHVSMLRSPDMTHWHEINSRLHSQQGLAAPRSTPRAWSST